jgi:GntR family transcriptional regulator/MocR family aminotransferase
VLPDPGDAAWIEDPGYPGAYGALLGAGAFVVPAPVDDEGLDVSAGIDRCPDK